MSRALLTSLFFVLALGASGCSGSTDPEPPAPSTSTTTSISEAEALTKAESVLADQDRDVDGLEVNPAQLFGEWQVSYEPPNTDALTGGFLVVLDAATGDLIEVVEYR